jgi:hypothetical protein
MSTPPHRPQMSPQPRRGSQHNGDRTDDMERALALRDVMDHAVRVQREITAPRPIRGRLAGRIGALLVCVPLLGFSAYSYVVRPEFIWGQALETSPVQRDAGLRFGMYLLAQRIESYRAQTGHYPESLEAVDGAPDGMRYRLISESAFELRSDNDSAVVLRSTEPVDAFLGNSPQVIQGLAK